VDCALCTRQRGVRLFPDSPLAPGRVTATQTVDGGRLSWTKVAEQELHSRAGSPRWDLGKGVLEAVCAGAARVQTGPRMQ